MLSVCKDGRNLYIPKVTSGKFLLEAKGIPSVRNWELH